MGPTVRRIQVVIRQPIEAAMDQSCVSLLY